MKKEKKEIQTDEWMDRLVDWLVGR